MKLSDLNLSIDLVGVPPQVSQAILTHNLVAVNRSILKRSQAFIESKLSKEDYAELKSMYNVQLATVLIGS